MNENNPNTGNNQEPKPPHPFDYQEHYSQQSQQYQNPQQPNNAQYYQSPPPQPPIPPVPPQPPVYPQYYGMAVDNTKAFSILSYIGILWLVGLLADSNNPRVRFHVNQGIILTIFGVVINVALAIVKGIINFLFIQSFSGFFPLSQLGLLVNGILTLSVTGVCFAFMIIGILHAVQDREEPLPIIGTLFQVLR